MKAKTRLYFYILLSVLMVADLYMIFNAGNPNSIIRPLVRDSGWDIFITFVISIIIMGIATLVFSPRRKEDDNLFILLKSNENHIKKLREKGKSDPEIGESFLKELKLKGLALYIARKRVNKYLAEIK